MTLKSLALGASLMALATTAAAEVKVGMITTLSGGGAGLGIDVRDGFMLAVKQSGRDDIEVLIEDDQQKPDIAVQLADKMIQAEDVDVLSIKADYNYTFNTAGFLMAGNLNGNQGTFSELDVTTGSLIPTMTACSTPGNCRTASRSEWTIPAMTSKTVVSATA